MAQVSPCISPSTSRSHDWFDTGHQPVGQFHFRGGRHAPTSRCLVHETPEGRRLILARPADWASPPWQLDAWFTWQMDLAWSASRALVGQTSPRLALLMVSLDMPARLATLHHLFLRPPTQDDEDTAEAVEAEVAADVLGCCRVHSALYLAGGDGAVELPKGMVAYRNV